MRKAVFLDRDGVINIDHGYVYQKEDFEWIPGVLESCKKLTDLGYLLVIITNQSGIARGFYTEEALNRLNDWVKDEFARAKAPLSGIFYCPHHPSEGNEPYRKDCDCRKPKPGLILQAQESLDIDLSCSVFFGDKKSDMLAATSAKIPTRVLLGTNGQKVPTQVTPATHVFRSLADALDCADFISFLSSNKAQA